MRRLASASLLALAMAVASIAPVFASSGHSITVWGTLNPYSHVEVHGNYLVPDGTQGRVVLTLYVSPDGQNWQNSGQFKTLDVVRGQTDYSFWFPGQQSFDKDKFFRVVGDGTQSRDLNKDECGHRVPEAPASSLLLIGAAPAFALVGLRVTRIRLPLPQLHRIF